MINTKEKTDTYSLIIRAVSLLIGCYIAKMIGEPVSYFILRSFLGTSESSFYIPLFIGYSFSGAILGYGLWFFFKQNALKVVIFSPPVVLFQSWYGIYFKEGVSDDHTAFEVLNFIISTHRGFYWCIVIPVAAFATIWWLQKYSFKLKSKDEFVNFVMPKEATIKTKTCPFCAEDIKQEAIICRFCDKELPVAKK